MHSAGWRRIGLAAVALVLVALACPAWAAPAPEDDSLKKQALALNDVTGEDAIKGQVRALLKDAPGTKKLLSTAVLMAKEKDQPFSYNALYILARSAHELKEYEPAETFYKLGSQQALKLQSGSKVAQTYGGLIDLLFEAKKYAECEKLCKEFLDIGGDDNVDKLKFAVFRRIIQVQAKQNKFEEANKLVDGLLKGAPDNWVALELKGSVQREAGSTRTRQDVRGRPRQDPQGQEARR
jgi:tetratricopeptide (TPR) repeat protein